MKTKFSKVRLMIVMAVINLYGNVAHAIVLGGSSIFTVYHVDYVHYSSGWELNWYRPPPPPCDSHPTVSLMTANGSIAGSSVCFVATASDNVSISVSIASPGGTTLAASPSSTSVTASGCDDTTQLTNGVYTYTATAIDDCGNSATATATIIVYHPPPLPPTPTNYPPTNYPPRVDFPPNSNQDLGRDPCNSCCLGTMAWGNADPGMPVWSVTEPYINLWVKDQPLGYQPGKGPGVSFQLAYKMRENNAGMSDNEFGVGKFWNFTWLSYVQVNAAGFQVHLPEGGLLDYASLGATDYQTYTLLTNNPDGSYQLIYPDGRTNVYAMNATPDGNNRFYLTEQRDRAGQKLTFLYENQGNPTPPSVAKLLHIIDADGKTNDLFYTNVAHTALITSVQDRFGKTCNLFYDSQGRLTNIMDVIQIKSSFRYDANNWMTNLITPYGTNIFKATEDNFHDLYGLQLTDAGGGNQLWVYQGTNSSSFYWGPRQFPNLTHTNDLLNLQPQEIRLSRWQIWTNATSSPTLLWEQDFSPDGNTVGQQTRYEYATGQSLPLKVSRVLPDYTTNWVLSLRNPQGAVTNEISTYSLPDNTVGTRTNRFVYSTNGLDLLETYNADGIRTSVSSYANHLPVTVTDAAGEWIHYTYNDSGQVTSITNSFGLFTTNIYFATLADTNRLATTINIAPGESGRTNTYTYLNGLKRMETDPRGNTTTFFWDDLGRPTGTSDILGVTTNIYDKLDIVRTVDRMGFTNGAVYDAMRRLKDKYDALGRHTHYEYCNCGLLDSMTDANTNTTSYTYDSAGHRTSVTGPDNYTVNYKLDSLGRPYCTMDSSGAWTFSSYNNQGLVIAVSNAAGRVSYRQFDRLDRMVYSVDANNVSTTNIFDPAGRLIRTGTPTNNAYTSYGYTPNIPGPISITNALSNVTLCTYNAYGRKTSEVFCGVSSGSLVRLTTNSFAYDVAGELKTLTDGNGHPTTWNFDQFGRATNKVDALTNVVFVDTYDADNRKLTHWTPAKETTSYGCDAVGNLKTITYPNSPAISLDYDAMNHLIKMVDGVGTTIFSNSVVGQITCEDGPWANDTVTIGYTNRLRTSLNLQMPSGSSWDQNYGYDGIHRLATITAPSGTFGYQYDPQRPIRVAKLTLPGGGYIANTFDALARLTDTRYVNPDGAILNGHGYGLNNGNQRKQQSRYSNLATSTVDYDYDPLGEIISAIGKEANGTPRVQEQFKYAYDAAGNLTFRTNNALVQSFGINALNQLTVQSNSGTLTVSGVTSSQATNVTVYGFSAQLFSDWSWARTNLTMLNGTNTFTAIALSANGQASTNVSIAYLSSPNLFVYDLNGNLTWDGQRKMDYDDENQLIRVTQTNVFKTEFVYDGLKRMRLKKEYDGTGVLTNDTRYVYDGILVVQERDANNNPQVTYTHGNDLSGTLQGAGCIGGLLARTDHQATNALLATAFYHCDGNGDITALVSQNGLILAWYIYDPFGRALAHTGPLADANVYRFSSKMWNASIDGYYYGRRFYSPNLQRWLNKDPIGEEGGINLYGLTGNDLIDCFDALGLKLDLTIRAPSFIKKIPLLGGMIHGVASIATGAVNTTLGVVTVGYSGTFKNGVNQVESGIKDTAQIVYSDTVGAALMVPGKVTMTGLDIFNLLTLGKMSMPDRTCPSGFAKPTDFSSALFGLIKDAPIPSYGFYLGPNWGTNQRGRDFPLKFLNQADYWSYWHDQNGEDREWVKNNLLEPPEGITPDGPVAAAIILYGAIPFWIHNGHQPAMGINIAK
jgi:RHS repeat-associated protein